MALRREDGQVTKAVVAWPRGRTALAGLAALVVLVATVLGGGGDGSAIASRTGAPRAVVLGEGGSLWAIADRYAPDGVDKRAYVDALVRLNGLQGAAAPGTRIELPR